MTLGIIPTRVCLVSIISDLENIRRFFKVLSTLLLIENSNKMLGNILLSGSSATSLNVPSTLYLARRVFKVAFTRDWAFI